MRTCIARLASDRRRARDQFHDKAGKLVEPDWSRTPDPEDAALAAVSAAASDLRKSVRGDCLSRSCVSDGVGDGAGVAGDVRRGVVDLVEEEGEGSGESWCGGLVEFDVDCAAVVGDGAGEV